MPYEDYYQKNKERLWRSRLAVLAQIPSGERLTRQKPRDPDEEKLLIKMDLLRRERMIASGELEQLGPQHWRWH